METDLPKHIVSVVLDGEESNLEFIEQPSIKVRLTFRSQWSCGIARLPAAREIHRLESRCEQYAALGTGCTMTAVPRSTQPSTLGRTVNEYQPYG